MTKARKVFFATLAAVAAVGLVKIMQESGKYTCNSPAVTVQEGQTLHGIAQANCSGNVVNAMDDLVLSLGTSTIYPGQEIQLPTQG